MSIIATVISVFVTRKYSRRSVIIPGYGILAFFNLLIGISIATDEDVMCYTITLAFVVIYQILNGSVIWLYLAEVSNDGTFGLAVSLMYFILIIVTLVTNDMLRGMKSGVFFIYSIICTGAAIFCYKYISETSNKTDI